MVILDGKAVEESVITPEKHRFIGTFRDSTPEAAYKMIRDQDKISGLYPHQLRGYWMEGRFDVPQYVTHACSGSPCPTCGGCSEPAKSYEDPTFSQIV